MTPDLHEAFLRQREIDREREADQLKQFMERQRKKMEFRMLMAGQLLSVPQPDYDGPFECPYF